MGLWGNMWCNGETCGVVGIHGVMGKRGVAGKHVVLWGYMWCCGETCGVVGKKVWL